MDTALLFAHNILRWAILVLLILSVAKSYSGWKGNTVFNGGDKKVFLFSLISCHITFLIGVYQWLWGRYGVFVWHIEPGTSFMKDKLTRFYWMEHPFTMIVSIVLVTLAFRTYKKAVDDVKLNKTVFILFALALFFILAGIPWPFREIVGRPLLPGG